VKERSEERRPFAEPRQRGTGSSLIGSAAEGSERQSRRFRGARAYGLPRSRAEPCAVRGICVERVNTTVISVSHGETDGDRIAEAGHLQHVPLAKNAPTTTPPRTCRRGNQALAIAASKSAYTKRGGATAPAKHKLERSASLSIDRSPIPAPRASLIGRHFIT